ncbi:MAG: hypothetical protein M3Q69_16800 [Acidobacteriota bacterium]|nr:hypothetical protein [Acidobacteriota bacterium]
MRPRPTAGALFATGLTILGFAFSFLLPAWGLSPRWALAAGLSFFILSVASLVAALRVYVSSPAGNVKPAILLDGYFTHDPSDRGEQGLFVRAASESVQDVQVQPFGMKGSIVTFDEVRMLSPQDGAKKLTIRGSAGARTLWDAATMLEVTKLQPVRISMTVKGRPVVTEAPKVMGRRRMYLRIKYRDMHGASYLNAEYFLYFIDSPRGISQETRLAVGRDTEMSPTRGLTSR